MRTPSFLEEISEDIGLVYQRHHMKVYRSFSIFSYRFSERFKNIKSTDVILQRPRSANKGPSKKQLRLQDRMLNIDSFIVSQFKKYLVGKVKNKNYRDIDDNMMKVFWDLKRGDELERKIILNNESVEVSRELERFKEKGLSFEKKRMSQQGDTLQTPFKMRMSIYAGVKMFRLSLLEPNHVMKSDSNIKRALAKMRIATKFIFHGKRGLRAIDLNKEDSDSNPEEKEGTNNIMRIKSLDNLQLKNKLSKRKIKKKGNLNCYVNYSNNFMKNMHKFGSVRTSVTNVSSIFNKSGKTVKSLKRSKIDDMKLISFPKLTQSIFSKKKGFESNRRKLIKSISTAKFSPYESQNNFKNRISNLKQQYKSRRKWRDKFISEI